jgi:penicillin-binding protein 2
MLANDLGVDAIHDFMAPLGLGQLTGIDVQGELRGTLPSTEWKRAAYRKPEAQRWYAGETISLGIGQGYNSFTMLQLAQATATLAGGGRRFKPHLVKVVESFETREQRRQVGEELPPLPWKAEDVAVIRKAMYGVTQEGTSRSSFLNTTYQSGGKTGTAQVLEIKANEKYNAKNVDERHRDNALYTAFAPVDAPQIALALVVENAGFGAGAAAPIARRVFDYVLNGQYPSEADIAATRLGQSTAPIGVPRPLGSVPLPGVTVDGSSAAMLAPEVSPGAAAAPVLPASAAASAVAADAPASRPGAAKVAATKASAPAAPQRVALEKRR